MSTVIADLHTHSEFSSDSTQSVELMAQTAEKKGISVLGISDHYDYNFAPDVRFPENFECDVKAKEGEILRVKELYRGRVTVLNGIELGIDVRNVEKCKEITENNSFDYIIGSQHIIDGFDPYLPEYWTGQDVKKSVERYFKDIVCSVEAFDEFDIFGHFDYVLRYPPTVKAGILDPEALLDSIMPLCEKALCILARKGKALEVNTGGIRSALGRTNPSERLVRRFLELGGEHLTFGSDAHESGHIGCGFDEFKRMLERIGLDGYTVFEARKPRKIKF